MLFKVFFLCVLFTVTQCDFFSDDDDHETEPYNFGYAIQDDNAAQYRKESGDEFGAVKGSYGFTDENGIRREVHYVADHNGFRAQVKTNEPGTISGNPADVLLHSSGRQEDDFHQYRDRF